VSIGQAYLAQVVLGPQDVVSSTDCVPAARMTRVATADDLTAAQAPLRPAPTHAWVCQHNSRRGRDVPRSPPMDRHGSAG